MKCSLRMLVRFLSFVSLISVTIFLATMYRMSKYHENPSQISQYSFLTNNDMQLIQNNIKLRKQLVQKTCQKYSKSKILHSPGGRYLNRMR